MGLVGGLGISFFLVFFIVSLSGFHNGCYALGNIWLVKKIPINSIPRIKLRSHCIYYNIVSTKIDGCTLIFSLTWLSMKMTVANHLL